MLLADKIINLRKKLGWSQEELAHQLQVSRQAVSKWESGMSIPDMNKIIGMSRLFGVSTDYLLIDEVEEYHGEGAVLQSEQNEEENVKSISLEDIVYWCVVVCIFFVCGFRTENWGDTWILWICAGILYAALCGLMSFVLEKKK